MVLDESEEVEEADRPPFVWREAEDGEDVAVQPEVGARRLDREVDRLFAARALFRAP